MILLVSSVKSRKEEELIREFIEVIRVDRHISVVGYRSDITREYWESVGEGE